MDFLVSFLSLVLCTSCFSTWTLWGMETEEVADLMPLHSFGLRCALQHVG